MNNHNESVDGVAMIKSQNEGINEMAESQKFVYYCTVVQDNFVSGEPS